jgi:hypothetical protein
MRAASMPAGPPPTTSTRRDRCAGKISNSPSRPTAGFTAQATDSFRKMRPTQV